MADKVFFDTNILVYTIGQHDVRTPVAEALVARGGTISVQVLNELAAVAHRKLKMSWQDIKAALDAIRTLCPLVVPLTAATHDAAMRLSVRRKLHIYDALIVAAALEARCGVLYSEDMQSGQVIGGRLRILNPFTS